MLIICYFYSNMTKAFKTSVFLLFFVMLLQGFTCRAEHNDTSQVRFIPMKWEHLPELNVPRAGHRFFMAGGEMVVVGGHTEGFVRTATAEYYKNGEWHLIKTIYPHDLGFSLKLGNGDYLLGGGCADDFGIGRTFGVERYDPISHSFVPYAILDTTRAICSAALLSSGEILVSGNWYAADAIAVSDGIAPFEAVKKTAQNRSSPYIFTYGKNNAVIFGSYGSRGESLPAVVDQLHCDPFVSDLLSEWQPATDYNTSYPDKMSVTDPDTGRLYYLFRGSREDGAQAVISFTDGVFSLVKTDHDIPIEGPWGPIIWYQSIYVDSVRGVALMPGVDEHNRVYLLSLDYRPMFKGEAVPIKVFYTHPMKKVVDRPALILPDGRFVTAGGYCTDDSMGNYNPLADVVVFYPFEDDGSSAGVAWWIWALPAVLLIAAAALFLLMRKRKNSTPAASVEPEKPTPAEDDKYRGLYLQLCEVMENEKLYARQGLSLADVASHLRTNTRYVSSCISAGAGLSFVEFVNGYRIRAAQELLLTHPEMRMNEISDTVGFANESSFYRNFKNTEGCTPQQWLERNKRKG